MPISFPSCCYLRTVVCSCLVSQYLSKGCRLQRGLGKRVHSGRRLETEVSCGTLILSDSSKTFVGCWRIGVHRLPLIAHSMNNSSILSFGSNPAITSQFYEFSNRGCASYNRSVARNWEMLLFLLCVKKVRRRRHKRPSTALPCSGHRPDLVPQQDKVCYLRVSTYRHSSHK